MEPPESPATAAPKDLGVAPPKCPATWAPKDSDLGPSEGPVTAAPKDSGVADSSLGASSVSVDGQTFVKSTAVLLSGKSPRFLKPI